MIQLWKKLPSKISLSVRDPLSIIKRKPAAPREATALPAISALESGNDHFVIKQASGAKTDSAFQRYNLVTEQEMKSIKNGWMKRVENPER